MGLPRQNTLMSWPSAIGDRSTSIGAPAAMVEASGFIWAMKGHSVASPPTAAAAPVATKRKSRRLVSTEDAVVTIPNPFQGCCQRNRPRPRQAAPERPAGARAPPRRQKDPCSSPVRAKQAVQNRSIGTLAGRAQARYRLAGVVDLTFALVGLDLTFATRLAAHSKSECQILNSTRFLYLLVVLRF